MPDGSWRGLDVPLVHGVARLASMLFAGRGIGELSDMLGAEPMDPRARAGWLMDQSWLNALNFAPSQAASLQAEALEDSALFRVRGAGWGPRLLAICAPGDLMVNAPLDFITPDAGLQLDLAFIRPGHGLPPTLPAHDAAFVAVSESAPDALRALQPAYDHWPRPILNDPSRILPMSRDGLSQTLAGLPGIRVARTWRTGRTITGPFPLLLRPAGSHGGHGLARLDRAEDAAFALAQTEAEEFYACEFIDYRGANGWYCKYRIAFVDGAPFICHMAASEHWMVHYLNAGMESDAAKRAAEEAAMSGFATGFAARHRAGLAAVAEAIGLDYFSIDCAESPCGRLLVFEADVAAIIHSMDPPELYPYKRAAMQLCYDAFGAMVRRRMV